jgi:hypothetical protein
MNEIEKAIKAINDYWDDETGDVVLEHDTLNTCMNVLREKQEQENPKPLTLEQLRERAGKWIWCETTNGNEIGWYKLDKFVAEHLHEYGYGITRRAYDYPTYNDEPRSE